MKQSCNCIFRLSESVTLNSYVINFLRDIVPIGGVVRKEKKAELSAIFKQMVWARSEEQYQKNVDLFILESKDVEVFPPGNKEPVLFVDYFARNWGNITSMWVTYHRRPLVTLNDNTNNRVER